MSSCRARAWTCRKSRLSRGCGLRGRRMGADSLARACGIGWQMRAQHPGHLQAFTQSKWSKWTRPKLSTASRSSMELLGARQSSPILEQCEVA
eukprot:7223703-Alexandrium_andersonii.AAC.1